MTSIAPYLYIAQCEGNEAECGTGSTSPAASIDGQPGVAPTPQAQQQAREEEGQGSPMGMVIMLLVLFAIFYFIGLRPQQKQAKRHRELMGSINEHDKVITSAGILGTITKMEGEVVTLQIDKNTSIQMLKDNIRGKQAEEA